MEKDTPTIDFYEYMIALNNQLLLTEMDARQRDVLVYEIKVYGEEMAVLIKTKNN